ncbi:MAG: hypothetical protein U0X93_15835 [Anaerolineales bacterium]
MFEMTMLFALLATFLGVFLKVISRTMVGLNTRLRSAMERSAFSSNARKMTEKIHGRAGQDRR